MASGKGGMFDDIRNIERSRAVQHVPGLWVSSQNPGVYYIFLIDFVLILEYSPLV